MSVPLLPERIQDLSVFMVGIKGTGMAALAEILVARGARVTGSDVPETFYTDAMLTNAGISWCEGFDAGNLRDKPDIVIYSAAYDRATHPELREAARLHIPVLQYTMALGQLSERHRSVGIAGVHGKTTTTALVASIAQELRLPGMVLAGSALADLGGRATLVQGDEFFVAETCEYRRNFLSFAPRAIVITSVEPDHLDYFSDAADIESAFVEYGRRLSPGGALIYCADDPGATAVAQRVAAERDDVLLLPYGVSAQGRGRVRVTAHGPGIVRATVGEVSFELRIPGDHNVLNAAAALLVARLVNEWTALPLADSEVAAGAKRALGAFHGTRRRSELVGDAAGVTVIDDYAHHPTAIAATLAGFRDFYPGRRIVLSFMSHTYSRTLALLDDFARSLSGADVLILHDIYASAREENPGEVDGEVLAVAAHRYSDQVHYVPAVADAAPLLERVLRPGDLFVTMGAGNNWVLGPQMLETLRQEIAQ